MTSMQTNQPNTTLTQTPRPAADHITANDTGGGSATLLRAVAVTKQFGGLVAVNKIDFTIPRGSIVSLIGPNGAGKTTFFNPLQAFTNRPPVSSISTEATSPAGRPLPSPHSELHAPSRISAFSPI